jgi:hypothetical protein
MNYEKVNDKNHLDALLAQGHTDFFISLAGGGLVSRKTIEKNGNKYYITNWIDGSTRTLVDLFDENETNIGKALKVGALYREV